MKLTSSINWRNTKKMKKENTDKDEIQEKTNKSLNKILQEGKAKERNQALLATEIIAKWKTQWKITILAWKFEAPNETFAETDESFREIVTKNQEKIKELNEIQDIDEFIRQSFEYIKWEMWLNPDISLKITDDDNHYDAEENTVYLSRNRTWAETEHVIWKWDKA